MTRSNTRLLTGLLIGFFGVAFQAFGVLTAMQKAMEELQGMRVFAWAFSVFLVGMVMAIVVAGRSTDRHGPTRPLTVGFALFTVGLAGATFAPHVSVLLTARLLQGFGSGAMNLTLFVLVAQLFDEKRRSQLMALLAFLWVLPAFLGPPAAGWIAENVGWRWVFGVTFVPIAVCALMALGPLWRLPRVLPDAQPEPVPVWAGIVLGCGALLLQMAGQRWSLLTIPLAITGAGLLIWVVPIIMPPRFWQFSAGLPSVIWVRALQSGVFFAAEPFLPLMLTRLRDLTLAQAGLVVTIGSIGWTLGSAAQSRPWLRLRRDQIITLGAVMAAAGFTLVAAYAFTRAEWFVVLALGWVLTGMGMGLSQASTSLAVMGLSEAHRQGRNTSSLQVAEGMGSALLTGFAGMLLAVWQVKSHPAMAFGGMFSTMAVLSVVTIVVSRRIGHIPNAVAER